MKLILSVFAISIGSLFVGYSQNFSGSIAEAQADIWDKVNSSKSIQVRPIEYDKIPKYLDFRGALLHAVQWTDAQGENILVQTRSGGFLFNTDVESEYEAEDTKAEIFAYLFLKPKGERYFKQLWRVYDFVACYGIDFDANFIGRATTITDLDSDGIAEIAMPYDFYCRGDVSPATMKIIMYEGNTKYALRGETMYICEPGANQVPEPSDNLKDKPGFLKFLNQRWKLFECESERE